MRSPLQEALVLKPRKGKSRKKLVAALLLTSLIDAFSIILLYLLVQNSGVESTLELDGVDRLPLATKIESIHNGTILKVDAGSYYINDQAVPVSQLAAYLQKLKEQEGLEESGHSLIIQADRMTDFSGLGPVIRAGSIAGFNKFKFAVLQGEGQL